MNVEQRVRDALRNDAKRLAMSTRPPVDALIGRRRRVRMVPVVATAVTIIAVVAVAMLWGGVSVPQIDPIDRPEPGPPPVEELPGIFDPDAVGFFEQGSIDGGKWRAAAGWQAPHANAPEGVGPSLCLALRWEVLPDGVDDEAPGDEVRCGTRLGEQPPVLEVTPMPRDPEDPRIAIMGVVSDEVDRLVWELTDRDGPVDIHAPSGLGRRVFAAVEHATTGDRLVAYAQDGTRLDAWEFSEPDPEGALEEWPRVTGEPVFTLDAHLDVDPGWWVSVAPGERDRWCVATSLDSAGPRFEDLCDQLLPPGQGDVFAVAGSLTMHDEGWLRWGTATRLDDDVELLVRYDDDTTEAVRHASAPELDFWLWAVAYIPELDDREPVSIDIVTDGEVTEHHTFVPTGE